MNEPKNKRPVIVGLFILTGIFFLIGGILIIGNLHSTFSKKISISTVFDNVNGLQPGNNIWFSGVKIGTVKKIEFFGMSQVKVIMNINNESKQYIRKDAKVKISTDGLIGNKILVIYGGTFSSPEIEEGDTLLNEKILSTEDILNTFQQNNLNVLALTKKLAAGEGTIGKLLNNDSIYYNISETIKSLQKASENAQVLLASLSNFSEKMNTKGTLANDLVTDTSVFYSLKTSVLNFQRISDSATVFVNNLKIATDNTKSPVGILLHDEQTGTDLKTTISNLKTSSEKLDKDLEALQHNFLLRRYFNKEAKKNKKQ
ncbi:MAG: ABC transporter permease [Bacteroidetes bacterium GWF2_38_335]|nr:MAG: ABC transporter permease [Bacteroidetes bacterium GWF2_38_335]OFY80445.1 MAG: ABC transporter permease [Bacteroidetes bacterium RIFOXYA12_FULL_38_20]HBS85951.1 MCE family protein [Bacteroidales bacterium]